MLDAVRHMVGEDFLCAALGGFLAGTPKLAQVRYPPPAVVAFGHGAYTPAWLAHAYQVLHGGC
jgi:hypothetical protein